MKIIFVFLVSFVFLILLFGYQYLDSNGKDFKIVFCDVGQGDSIYMRVFNKDIIVDGGPEGSSATECLSRHMPFLDRNVELMVVTHADSDHYAGFLDTLDRYTVSYFATTPTKSETLGYQALLSKLENNNIPVRELTQGDRIKIKDLFTIDVLWPDKDFTVLDSDTNNSSLVFLVDFVDFETVLTGDLDKEYLNLLLEDLKDIEVFKLAHHGSRTSTDQNTFKTFKPDLSVISVGRNNKFGHPHREVENVLKEHRRNYKSTQNGDIVIKSNGKSWTVN